MVGITLLLSLKKKQCSSNINTKKVKVLVAKSRLTLCNSMDCSPPGSSVHGISQARILEWLPFPSPGDLPDPGIKLTSPALQADTLPLSNQGSSILETKRKLRVGFIRKILGISQ